LPGVDKRFAGRPTAYPLPVLYVRSKVVIPPDFYIGVNPAEIQVRNTGFRVKPGMTIKTKGLLKESFLVQSSLLLKLSKDAPDLRKGLDGCLFTFKNGFVPL